LGKGEVVVREGAIFPSLPLCEEREFPARRE
jgi:hypothetical protein